MSAEVINLRQARKQRERDARRRKAEENRIKHGCKKAERERAEKEAKAQAELLDGHWLDHPVSDDQAKGAKDDEQNADRPIRDDP